MTRANPLPDDVETLKAMLLSQEAALRERDAQMLKLQETVDSQQAALASREICSDLVYGGVEAGD
nr:hypothetical protein [Paraburkholderia sp. BL8N3]